MATIQATQFGAFAGQEIASGVRSGSPLIGLETEASETVFENLSKINGLMPKFSDILIYETRVYQSPLDQVFRKVNEEYGSAVEMAIFKSGAPNKLNDGTCFPRGNVAMVDQFAIINSAYDIDIDIKDREINKAVMNKGQVDKYVAEKMRTPLKTLGVKRHTEMVQLISDITDGSRTIVSTDSSDGTGSAVTYSQTVKGYAGEVIDNPLYMPEVEVGVLPSFAQASDALSLAQDIEGLITDMYIDSATFTLLGNSTMLQGKPWLIMESKILNAMDNIFSMNGGYAGFPTVSARQWLGRVADVVEIPSFASMPTSLTITDKRVGAVILDKDAAKEFVYTNTVEAARCTKGRSTGYSYQGESAFSIFKGVPSAAITFSTEEPEDGES